MATDKKKAATETAEEKTVSVWMKIGKRKVTITDKKGNPTIHMIMRGQQTMPVSLWKKIQSSPEGKKLIAAKVLGEEVK